MRLYRQTTAVALTLCFSAPCAATIAPLSFPAGAETTASHNQPMTTYDLPTGPFKMGALTSLRVEGAVEQTAWRVGAEGIGTLNLLAPLRAQLQDQGFTPLFECQDEACGGYDFRYAADVLPEPEMHVDLGDFRYFAARRAGPSGPEFVALLVSRSAHEGFVQLTRIGRAQEPSAQLVTSTKSPDTALQDGAKAPPLPDVAPAAPASAAPGLAGQLESGQPAVLEGLVFPSGSADLAQGDYVALQDLAAWLKADASRKAMLVGHTDASGAQEPNQRLSKARAESVRSWLIDRLNVAPAQLTAEGAGFLAPRVSNATEDGRRQNRRVEVIATSTLSATP